MEKDKNSYLYLHQQLEQMITKITTVSDVADFMKQLVVEGTNCHPDEDFNNYINIDTNEQVYSDAEAATRNLMMGECFKVCGMAGVDIYDLIHDIYLIEMGMDKFIPTSLHPGKINSVEFDD